MSKQNFSAAVRSANINGFVYGITQSIMPYSNTAIFAFGAYLIQNQLFGTTFEKVMVVLGVIIFASTSLGLN
jgi:hypothetical protein